MMGRGAEKNEQVKRFSLEEQREEMRKLFPDLDLFEVGGSLRDEMLGFAAKDLDLCAVGQSSERLGERLGQSGRVEELRVANKTIGFRFYPPFAPEGIEIALARREESTGDGHGDFSFFLDPETTIEEDLARRDFTCNALARNLQTGEMIDPFMGRRAIEEKLLQETSAKILEEDPLRVLRGLRLIATHGFYPERETSASMKRAANQLSALSSERIFSELERIISAEEGERALSFALNEGWYNKIFPELEDNLYFNQQSPHHSLPVDRHGLATLASARSLTAEPTVLWAAYLHDCGKPASAWMGDDGRLHYYADPKRPGTRSHEEVGAQRAQEIFARLRAPKYLEEEVLYLIREHMFFDDRSFAEKGKEYQERRARRFLAKHGRKRAEKLLLLRLADLGGKDASPERMRDARSFARSVRSAPEITYQDLEIDGRDLLALGASGREVGEILEKIKSRIVDNPHLNEKTRLLNWARRIMEE